jgi:drug/metabolite transporter (DMT)-like permease
MAIPFTISALGIAWMLTTTVAWFAILFTGRYPQGLWDLAAFYLRWRVRAVAYTALLRDEYPPFGEGAYAAVLGIETPAAPRNRLTVAFRIILAVPHLLIVWALGIGYLWFGDVPNAWMLVGCSVIIASGLYVFYREAVLGKS